MAFFDKFPKVIYNFAIAGEPDLNILVTDFLYRIKISNTDISNNGAFQIYSIKDGETPEIISMKYYGTQEYFWIILMINDLFYGLESFPKSYEDLDTYISNVYGAEGKYATHHYEDSNGNQINSILHPDNLKPLTGSITSYGADVVGVNTIFASELVGGDYITTDNVNFYRVEHFLSDGETPFTDTLLSLTSYPETSLTGIASYSSISNLKIFNPVTLTFDLMPIANYTAITNMQYEDIKNEKKRNIYLLRPEYIKDAIKTINNLLVGII